MIYTKKIAVDLSHQYLNDVIRLHEGDAGGAQIKIEVFDNGSAFDLTGYTVKFDAVIAGYLAEEDQATTTATNTITVPITKNMCAKSGTLAIDVKIIEGSGDSAKVMFLQKFEAFVQRRVINEDVIIDVSGTTIEEQIEELADKFPVGTEDIADGAVTDAKLAGGAVTAGKLGASAVTTAKINNGAVTKAKLAEKYGKITVMSYTDASALNFTLPTTYEGELGDIVVMTTGSGSGGRIWQLEKIVSSYGSTDYYWIPLPDANSTVPKTRKVAGIDLQDDITTGELKNALEVMDKVYAANTEETIAAVPVGQLFTAQGRFCRKLSASTYDEIASMSDIPTVPTNVSSFTNDAGYVTAQGVSGKMDKVYAANTEETIAAVPVGQLFTAQGRFCRKLSASTYDEIASLSDVSGKMDKTYAANTPETIAAVPTGQLFTAVGRLAHKTAFGYDQIANLADIGVKENVSNKVTSLSSSSTDTQYPSAKCVYDLIGDIESALAALL